MQISLEDLVSTILFLLDWFFYTFMTLCHSSSMLRFLALVCSTQLVREMHSNLMCKQVTYAFVPNLLLSPSSLPGKEPLHMLLYALRALLLLLCMSLSFASDAMDTMLFLCAGISCILHQSCCYRYNAGSFFANWAAVLLSLLTAQSIGLLIGSVITHPKTGQTIATITALTMILVSTAHPIF